MSESPDVPTAAAVAVPDGATLRRDEPLSRHLPLRTGGPCDGYLVVHRREALADALQLARDLDGSITLIGQGTRTLVRDAGLAGTVIRLGHGFARIRPDETGWWVGAAVRLGALSALEGLPGPLRSLAFHPGSLGASVSLDEGWEPWVDAVRYRWRRKEREGTLAKLSKAGKRAMVLEVHLRREPSEEAAVPAVPRGWYAEVDGDEPAELVVEAKLAGTRLRSVLVPTAAPDTLVNLGGATSKDLELLQKSVIDRVHRERGVKLANRMSWLGRRGG